MKPILFNTDMVQALLAGTKTCTRRVIKPQPPATSHVQHTDGKFAWAFFEDSDKHWIRSPYQPGDILYVRETWALQQGIYWHKAGLAIDENGRDVHGTEVPQKWHPSIHMPKGAARLFLRVTDVLVERLQDITEDGVCEEGVEPLVACKCEHTIYNPEGGMEACWNTDCCSYCSALNESYAERFGKLVWNRTIKPSDLDKYGWDANPWVWMIEFERCEKPEAKHES